MWRGKLSGTVGAVRDQAKVAAQNVVESGSAVYSGSPTVQRLKVPGVDLLCLGDPKEMGHTAVRVPCSDRYLRVVLDERGMICGAVVLGLPELAAQLAELFRSGAGSTASS